MANKLVGGSRDGEILSAPESEGGKFSRTPAGMLVTIRYARGEGDKNERNLQFGYQGSPFPATVPGEVETYEMGADGDWHFVLAPGGWAGPPTRSAAARPTMTVYFKSFGVHSLTIDEANPSTNEMRAVVVFDMETGGQRYTDLEIDAKLGDHSDYESDPIEFTTPRGGGYEGRFPIHSLLDATAIYYRGMVGHIGQIIRRHTSNRVLRAGGVSFVAPVMPVVLDMPEVEEEATGGWLLDGPSGWMRRRRSTKKSVTPLGQVQHPADRVPASAENLDRQE